jgi:hypothetical protein
VVFIVAMSSSATENYLFVEFGHVDVKEVRARILPRTVVYIVCRGKAAGQDLANREGSVSTNIHSRRKPQIEVGRERLHRMQEQAQHGVSYAADRIGPASVHAREVAAERILDAREWSAPQLERAAAYVESELGPRISAFLFSTAQRMQPTRTNRRSRNVALTTLALVGLAGAAGAMATRRNGMLAMRSDDLAEPMPMDRERAANGQVRMP